MLTKLCQPTHVATASVAIALAAFGVAIPASAAQPADTEVAAAQAPNRCGAGYGLVDSENLNALGPNFGTVYLYYNRTAGKNCVFTEKRVARGTPTYTTADPLCRLSDGACARPDRGNFKYYAGPIYLSARGTCVKWGGRVTNTDGRYDQYTSAWEHCG